MARPRGPHYLISADPDSSTGVCPTCGPVKVWNYAAKGKPARYVCSVDKTRSAREYNRNKDLLKLYGITVEQYQEKLDAQGGVCAICQQQETVVTSDGVRRNLCVDHDHSCCSGAKTCGKCIRGLLCQRCNVMLGYLEKHGFHNFEAYLSR